MRESSQPRQVQTHQSISSEYSPATTSTGTNTSGSAFGRRIDEDHVNYVLMYDMLTGIRIAVSRNQAKPRKSVAKQDFRAAHKLAFDIVGNELTPSSKYDFKFKDYAPWIFRELRDIFRIDPAEYLISLTGKYVLSELGSPGKSGSFFYYSQDYRFIIKTIRHAEHLYLRRILPQYYDHVKNHPNTLLSRFIGLHRVKLPRGRKIHFVVMGNIFPPNRIIHEIYDLKGSTLGRIVTAAEEQASGTRVVKKDRNWLKSGRRLFLSPEKRAIFLEQLIIDEKFLEAMNIMDYSLLIGIHYSNRALPKYIPYDRVLSVYHSTISDTVLNGDAFTPSSDGVLRIVTTGTDESNEFRSRVTPTSATTQTCCSLNRIGTSAVVMSAPSPTFAVLPEQSLSERAHFRFYQESGGFCSTNEDGSPMEEVYFLGIIDILTPYGCKKKMEHIIKAINYDPRVISAIRPKNYGKRFLEFIRINVLHIDRRNRLVLAGMKTKPSHRSFSYSADDGFQEVYGHGQTRGTTSSSSTNLKSQSTPDHVGTSTFFLLPPSNSISEDSQSSYPISFSNTSLSQQYPSHHRYSRPKEQ